MILKSTEEFYVITMKNDGSFEKKLNWVLENDMNFHRLKNSDFMLESKMADLNQNNSKQPGRPDVV